MYKISTSHETFDFQIFASARPSEALALLLGFGCSLFCVGEVSKGASAANEVKGVAAVIFL